MTGRTARRDRDGGQARISGLRPDRILRGHRDGESVALVARDGAIDWWAAPAIDSPPVSAALLDPEGGGCFSLEPAVPYQASRRYCRGRTCSRRRSATGSRPWARTGTCRSARAGRNALLTLIAADRAPLATLLSRSGGIGSTRPLTFPQAPKTHAPAGSRRAGGRQRRRATGRSRRRSRGSPPVGLIAGFSGKAAPPSARPWRADFPASQISNHAAAYISAARVARP
jgi:Domain of unknown function (DUF5911)